MTEAATSSDVESHPIRLIVTDDLRRNRLTVFFRIILAIPHLILVSLWALVALLAVIVNWIVVLIGARSPEALHAFIAKFLRYQTQVAAYLLLIADPWPSIGGGAGYPVDLQVDRPEEQGRLGVLFRVFLAIPALLLASVFRSINNIIAFLGWFYALATGRMSEGMRNLSAWCLRYEQQTYGYVFVLTSRYPSLAGGPSA